MAGKNLNKLLKKYNLTEKQVIDYIMINGTEDFPMDQTLEDFYKKIKGWWEINAEYYK